MNVLQVPVAQSVAMATGLECGRASRPRVVGRAALRALRTVGGAFTDPQVLWWLGLPWDSQWPHRTDGRER
jgi:hypothetical protein